MGLPALRYTAAVIGGVAQRIPLHHGDRFKELGQCSRSHQPRHAGAQNHRIGLFDEGFGLEASGWKGREYLIVQKGEMGPEVTERVGLSGDGRQLIDKVHIGAAELSAVDFTRVYNRTNEAAPRQLPVSD